MNLTIKIFEHLRLTLFSLFIALFIAVPLGIALARMRFQGVARWVIRVAMLIQTVPGLAMLSLIVILIAALRSICPLPTTGAFPALLALCAYAILPILTNTYTGIRQVSPLMVEAAVAMGMTRRQVLILVQLPSSLSFIISGIRISAMWILSMATLTSLIGSGGLGDLIMQGLRSMHWELVISGTVPLVILAILIEWGISKVERWLVPMGEKVST